VVAVLVRDEYRVDVRGREAGARQPRIEMLEPEAAVDQQPRTSPAAAGFDQRGVAGAAAAQAAESQHAGLGLLEVVGDDLHDAREPLQLRCSDGARHLGILTDLGHATPHVLSRLSGLDALLLEFNHDSDMLARSTYPPFLQHRVGGNYGHLSNAAAAAIARALNHDRLHHVLGAHLSEQNNRPELVRRAMAEALGASEHEMLTANASEGCDWLELRV
jgi:hypothetical protein